MPMIERTAASLEPRGIHRVFPSLAPFQNPLWSRRKLHTAFWHHSAANLELSNAWQVLIGTTTVNTTRTSINRNDGLSIAQRATASALDACRTSGTSEASGASEVSGASGAGRGGASRASAPSCNGSRGKATITSRAATLATTKVSPRTTVASTSSSFLIGFLYPNGILSGILSGAPRIYPSLAWPLDRFEMYQARPRPGFRFDSRPYTSSTSTTRSEGVTITKEVVSGPNDEAPHQQALPPPRPFQNGIRKIGSKQVTKIPPPEPKSAMEKLQTILDKGTPEKYKPLQFEKVYELWNDTPPEIHEVLRIPVFTYLCEVGGRTRHIDVLKDLLLKIPNKKLTRGTLSTAVHSQLHMIASETKAFSSALEFFQIGLAANVVGGLGVLVSHFFERRQCEKLVKLVLESGAAMERRGTCLPRQNFLFAANTKHAVESATMLIKYVHKNYTDPGSNQKKILDGLVNSIVGHLADNCEPGLLIPLVDLVRSQKMYHKVLRYYLDNQHDTKAIALYRLYRHLPGLRINVDILHDMYELYINGKDPQGIEEILADWKRHHRRLSIHAYTKFLTYYAKQGNLRSTELLWNEFVNLQKQWIEATGTGRFRAATFTFMLNVYAERGDLSDAKRFFREMSNHVRPTKVCWNILLKAHRKANDYAGAVEVFRGLCQRFQVPDLAALRVMVQMAGSRGDLEFVLSLVNDLKSYTGQLDMNMMAGVIEALCQNEQFQDAEKTTLDATREVRGDSVCMWNVLLQHSALRHDLTNLSRLLGLMSENKVKFSSDTYAWLLRGLAYCRQTRHGYKLLTTALKDDVFNVTAEHFLIVLSSAIGTHDFETSLQILDLMRSPNLPKSTNEILGEVAALQTWHKFRKDFKTGLTHAEFLASTLSAFRRCIVRIDNQQELTKREMVRASDVEKMVVLCVLMKSYGTAHDLVSAFMRAYPQDRHPERYTHQLYNALLVAYAGERDFEHVDQTWDALFQGIKKDSRTRGKTKLGKADKPKISLRMVASFQQPLTSMLRSCFLRNDPIKLKEVVKEVREAGFELNNLNWNFYVQFLARMEQHTDAFMLCEKILMPGWVGWHNRISLNQRHMFQHWSLPLPTRQQLTSRLYLNPTKFTILMLSKSLMDIEAASTWSTSATQFLDEIQANSTRVMQAVKSLGSLFQHELKILRDPNFYAKNVAGGTTDSQHQDGQKQTQDVGFDARRRREQGQEQPRLETPSAREPQVSTTDDFFEKEMLEARHDPTGLAGKYTRGDSDDFLFGGEIKAGGSSIPNVPDQIPDKKGGAQRTDDTADRSESISMDTVSKDESLEEPESKTGADAKSTSSHPTTTTASIEPLTGGNDNWDDINRALSIAYDRSTGSGPKDDKTGLPAMEEVDGEQTWDLSSFNPTPEEEKRPKRMKNDGKKNGGRRKDTTPPTPRQKGG